MALNGLENHKGKKKHTTLLIVISKAIQCPMPMVELWSPVVAKLIMGSYSRVRLISQLVLCFQFG